MSDETKVETTEAAEGMAARLAPLPKAAPLKLSLPHLSSRRSIISAVPTPPVVVRTPRRVSG